MFSSEWFGDISPGNKCCSRYFVHAVSTVDWLSRFAISFRYPVAKVFLAQKSSNLILLMILSGPKLHRKLEFQFGVLTFPLSCLRKTQISLQIFESPHSRHAECYCTIFEPLFQPNLTRWPVLTSNWAWPDLTRVKLGQRESVRAGPQNNRTERVL